MDHTLTKSHVITHQNYPINSLDFYKDRLKKKESLTLPWRESLNLLEQLYTLDLGRFLLANRGLNGYWTAYLMAYDHKIKLHPLEHWLINHAPTVVAGRERFTIFKQNIQEALKDHDTVASIPCGIMEDLIQLDTQHVNHITFIGIDMDTEALLFAKNKAQNKPNVSCQFLQKDAFSLTMVEACNIIASNGLNLYVQDEERLIQLYSCFFKALKTKGMLITSFLTPPSVYLCNPWTSKEKENLLKQKAIFNDILEVTWQQYSTEEAIKNQLKQAGFSRIQVIQDKKNIFPTVIAYKE